jgi:DGQHR domain-containing protein
MKRSYEGNQQLRDLAQSMDFKAFIFDDPTTFGPEILLREKSKDGEIDGVLLFENVICLVGINEGRGNHVERELTKFFEKLDKIKKVEDVGFDLRVTARKGKKIEEKKRKANEALGEVENCISDICKEYRPILRKIFFCPSMRIEEERMAKLETEGSFIVDRDIFDYFLEVLSRLDKRFLKSDFMHFLKIRKTDLQKKSAAKMQKPGRSAPFQVNRLELEKDKIIMYSLPIAAEDIMNYVTVLRVARKYDKKGFQRMVKSNRLNSISADYLMKNQTFPNNIIVGLNPDLYTSEKDFYDTEKNEFTFLDEFNSLIIIDGQHRFFSLVKRGELGRHILVTLIFFNNKDKDQNSLSMVKMFYEINKSQERIDPNLSFILKAKIDPDSEENFWHSAFTNLDKKGFFARRFSFKETTLKKKDDPRSIVSVITYGGALRLNKSSKKKGIEVSGLEAFYGADRKQNIDFAFHLLKNYFDIIEAVLHDQSVDKNSLTPREIGALIRLIKHFMVDDRDKLKVLGSIQSIDETSAECENAVRYFKGILSCLTFEKAIQLEYPASNWAAVEGYILRTINSSKPNFGNRNILSKKGLEVYNKQS